MPEGHAGGAFFCHLLLRLRLKLRKGAALDLLKPFLKKGLKNPKNFCDGLGFCFVSGFRLRERIPSIQIPQGFMAKSDG